MTKTVDEGALSRPWRQFRNFAPLPWLIASLAVLLALAAGLIGYLYWNRYSATKARLHEITLSLGAQIEWNIASRGLQQQPEGAADRLFESLRDAFSSQRGFGRTGALLAGRPLPDGGTEVVQAASQAGPAQRRRLPPDDPLLAPIQRALRGESGVMVAPDRHGQPVIAAYTPLLGGRLALLAKQELAELRRPFYLSALGALAVVLAVGVFGGLAIRGSVRPVLAAKALTDAQARLLAHAVAHMSESLIITDAEGRIQFVNPAFGRITGYQPEEVEGKTPRILKGGGTPNATYQELWRTIRSGQVWRGVLENRAMDGRLIPMEVTISPIQDGRGAVTHFIGIQTDVSGRLLQARLLEESEQRYRQLVEGAAQGIVIVQEGRFAYCNPAIARTLGVPEAAALVGTPWLEWIVPEDRERVAAHRQALIAGKDVPAALEFRVRTAGGQTLVLESHAQRILWQDRPAVLSITLDVTQVRHLEEQLVQAQRLESVGRLAGGVAHDFNNILTVISAHAAFLAEALPKPSQEHADAQVIQDASRRAAELTRQLLAFSRRQVLQMRVLDLNQAVAGMEKMLRRLIGEDIQVRLNLAPRLAPVKADESQITQILMNLAVNARDAMPRGGTLGIETANQALDESYISRQGTVRPGNYAMLAVSDSGTGMSEEVLGHIFEPFYTTKPQGKGTGLGLATVYGIVKQMNGWIFVYSEPGHGTTFKIYFPAVEGAVEQPAPAVSVPHLKTTGTILLVEDDELVRHSAQRILDSAGYRVLAAASPAEALALIQSNEMPVDLLFTDLVMPEMTGTELWRRIRAVHELPVLFMSGYSDERVGELGLGQYPLLSKPFSRQSLLEKVQAALAGQA